MTKRFLSNEELKKYICGAVYFDENDGLIPYRFTKEKLDAATDPARKIRQSTGTGIKIEFYSDTEELSFNYTAFIKFVSGIYKLYFFDVYADDVLVLHQGEKDVDEDRRGTVNVKFKAGNKRITIYLPGSCAVNITDFAISDGAEISPVSYNGKTLFLGDSITHAAYVDFPSFTYANRVTKKLGCYTVNEAIGGDVFSVHHLENLPDIDFDTVFIAYGTNDWKWANASSPERIKAFFEKLNAMFGKKKIRVILPIWRSDKDENPDFVYSFDSIRKMICDTASEYKMNVIDVFDMIPHDPVLYYEYTGSPFHPNEACLLHPNEMGFVFYANAVGKCTEE